jgi:septal ring factor EnvC (AmiA/AmiB activator)
LEATKRDARREEQRLTQKFEAKLQEVNENVEKLRGDLSNAENSLQMVTVQLQDMTAAKERVMLEKERGDRQFLQTISARNMERFGLKQDVESLNTAVQERDGIIERYETSYRELIKLSFQLTSRRIKKAPSKLVDIVRRISKDKDDELR